MYTDTVLTHTRRARSVARVPPIHTRIYAFLTLFTFYIVFYSFIFISLLTAIRGAARVRVCVKENMSSKTVSAGWTLEPSLKR